MKFFQDPDLCRKPESGFTDYGSFKTLAQVSTQVPEPRSCLVFSVVNLLEGL